LIRIPLIALALLALISAPLPAQDAAAAQPRTITTSGEAVVYVTPDEVQVTFGIETFDPDLDKAKAANDERGNRFVKSVTALGVEPKNLQTDHLSIEIQYRNRTWEGIGGYMARRTYSVKLTDTKLFEKLMNTGLKNGANQLLGFEFRTTQLRQHRDRARKMAIKAAREKAVDLAAELECGIGKPRTISEAGGYYGMQSFRYGNMMAQAQNAMQQMPPGDGGGENESLALGQIGIHAQVSVTFDLTDRVVPPEAPKGEGR